MKKRLFLVTLIVLMLVAASALAIDAIYVGTEKEPNGGESLNQGSDPSKALYYVDWIDPPDSLTALTVNNRVSLSWEEVPAVDLYGVKEKINGKWTLLKSEATTATTIYATPGEHIYGVSSVWQASSGDFYESDLIIKVTVTVYDSDDTPGASDVVHDVTLSGYSDRTETINVYENTFIRIHTDSLTWMMSKDSTLIEPDRDVLYYTSLGTDYCIKGSKHLNGNSGVIICRTFNYTETVYNGQKCYVLGDTRATLTLKLVKCSGYESPPYVPGNTKDLTFFNNVVLSVPTTFYEYTLPSGNLCYRDTGSDVIMSVQQNSGISDYAGLKQFVESKYGKYGYVEFTSDNGIPMIVTLDSSGSNETATYFFISQGKLVYIIFVYNTQAAETISTNIVDSARLLSSSSPASMQKIREFVNRCYTVILGRGADAEGLEAWANALATGARKAAEIIDGFVNSPEFLNKGLTKSQQVVVLYRAMLGRNPDQAGLAAWTDVLNQGYPFGSVINGFCGSTEFINLCNEYGIEPGSVSVGPVTPAGDNKIKAFVSRCYQIILGRGADAEGLEAWANALATGVRKASEIIDGFVNSPEFLNKGLTKDQQVDVLYQAMLGRAADPAGKAAWVQVLNEGHPFAAVINGFCGSTEFINICAEYGIQPGSVQVKAAFVKREAITPEGEESGAATVYRGYNSEYINEEKIRAFVEHCYESVLGRQGDAEGIEAYTQLILDGKKTPKKVAYEFVFSTEFQGKLPGNEEFIRILYRLYLNREPGAEELAGWVEMLEGGTGLEEIVNGFAESAEFRAIVKEMKE